MRLATVVCVIGMLAASVSALTVPNIFSNGMILQTNSQYGARAFVYGYAQPGEQITLAGAPRRSAQGVPYDVLADQDGRWIIQLDPNGAGSKTYVFVIRSSVTKEQITIRDVRYGDVYLCSGQSNMVKPMSYIFNSSGEIATAAQHTNFQLFTVHENRQSSPSANVTGKWLTCSPETVTNFSAVCYLTIRDLMRLKNDNNPVGLVFSAVGGTAIEEWMSPAALKECPSKPVAKESTLYNGMISPLARFSLRAVLWYQGENNADAQHTSMEEYQCKFAALINSWRNEWLMGDWSFNYVQLAPFPSSPSLFPPIRQAQLNTLPSPNGLVDTTGMAVTIDLGDIQGGIHPRNKSEVGRRLALSVLHTAFAVQPPNVFFEGPLAQSAQYINQTTIKVLFAINTTDGMALTPTHDCHECCSDLSTAQVLLKGSSVWVNATAFAVDADTLLVSVAHPNAVQLRLMWSDFPQCALLNQYGLCGSPVLLNVTQQPSKELSSRPLDSHLQPSKSAKRAILGALPPMGFNSWNAFHCNIDERIILQTAELFESLGLKAVGYEYVNIDDCWQVSRAANNSIVPDPVRFPSGLLSISRKLHSQNLKFGIYTAAHQFTCQHRPGSWQMESIDSQSYCDFEIDYLKIDKCGGKSYPEANTSWIHFRNGFNACAEKTGRDIYMSVETCGSVTGCGEWIGALANQWRTGGDIEATFLSVMKSAHIDAPLYSLAGPGHWNDPDMLQVGNPGLSVDESRTHFGLWCVLAAPLLIGTNLADIETPYLDILRAKEVIAIDQDPLGIQGRLLYKSSPQNQTEVWYKELTGGSVAVIFINVNDDPNSNTKVRVNFADIPPLAGKTTFAARDLWKETNLGDFQHSYETNGIAFHASDLIKFTPK